MTKTMVRMALTAGLLIGTGAMATASDAGRADGRIHLAAGDGLDRNAAAQGNGRTGEMHRFQR
ncbi:hypothetical protein ACFQ12_24175, partial [Methylobacterium trifolii]